MGRVSLPSCPPSRSGRLYTPESLRCVATEPVTLEQRTLKRRSYGASPAGNRRRRSTPWPTTMDRRRWFGLDRCNGRGLKIRPRDRGTPGTPCLLRCRKRIVTGIVLIAALLGAVLPFKHKQNGLFFNETEFVPPTSSAQHNGTRNATTESDELTESHRGVPGPSSESNSTGSNTAGGQKLEFVHVTKSGGTSIESAAAKHGVDWGVCKFYRDKACGPLRQFPHIRKQTIEDWVCKIDTSPWHCPPSQFEAGSLYSAAKTFAIVRNPYDR